MHRALVAFLLGSGLCVVTQAQDAVSAPRWSISAECRMVVLPQKTALTLLPELMDAARIDAACARLEQMVASKAANQLANLVLTGEAPSRLVAESIEELRYPTEFDPPQVPNEVPKEKAAEVLKNWPIVGITPTAFETRNIGATLELETKVSEDGKWIVAEVVPQHVRLLRFDKYDAGVMPSGERLSVEQPQFLTLKTTLSVHVRSGQRILAGVHHLPNLEKLPNAERMMELFIIQISAKRTGAVP